MKSFSLSLSVLCCAGLLAPPVGAAEVALMLNWTPNAEHAPYYYALEQGWYRRAGLELNIEAGRGSQLAVQQASAGKVQFAVADLPTALAGRGNGSRVHAVMAIYQHSPQAFYWLQRSRIAGPRGFPGRSIGNPPGDAARLMWPMFARAVGVPPQSVRFVSVSPQAKIAALKSGAVDIISDFYPSHDQKVAYFGNELRFVTWREVGLNLYGNALLVNSEVLRERRAQVARFVEVTQRAFGQCVVDEKPCIDALLRQVSGLDRTAMVKQWGRVEELMRPAPGTAATLGAFDPARLQADYRMVERTVGLRQPYNVHDAVTNEFLRAEVTLAQ